MNQAFLDYYSLEPFTQWIHRTLCGVMPEDWAVFIEGLALGIVILLAYAVLAVVLIYMERRVCGAFQCVSDRTAWEAKADCCKCLPTC